MPLIRFDKFIADRGVASRKEIKQLIKSGRALVDGRAEQPDFKLNPEVSVVTLDGKRLEYKKYYYYMLNKPAGILSATDDGKQKTVLDLVSPEMKKQGLFPVGRLDKDTRGLLLLTNDGEFAHKVISPKSGISKVYHAVTEGIADERDAEAFRRGVTLADGTRCLPADLKPLPDGSCLVCVMEGKYHQVKRMLASRGKPVAGLKRLSIGGLELPEELAEGEFRELTSDELCRVMMKK